MTLRETLAAVAAELPDAVARDAEDSTEWAVGAVTFAAVREATAEFRLSGAIARAALDTSGAAPSPRGGEWVAFSPETLDRVALDRASAWFASAYRHAADRRA